jgi:hypothetical protein
MNGAARTAAVMHFRALKGRFVAAWDDLWRGALLALAIAFAHSTQLLFEVDLYGNWPLADILLGWLDLFTEQLVSGVCIFAALLLAALVPVRSVVARASLCLAAIALGALAGQGLLLRGTTPAPLAIVAEVARWLVIGTMAFALYVFQRQGAAATTRAHEAGMRRLALDRQWAETRLQTLRAQLEPHFLFNTLANIRQLFRTEPERGRRMLASFVAYLRAALPQLRHDETTLGREVELARAYLDVLQVRMGPRLRVSVDVAPELAALPFPPFALSTLTENAIKHGLNALPGGGQIAIQARPVREDLEVTVADTGPGLRGSGGTGSGLANLRAQLHALYGAEGRLAFENNVPRGLRVTITVPRGRSP